MLATKKGISFKPIAIAIFALVLICCACVAFTNVLDKMGFLPTSTPTLTFTITPILPTATITPSPTITSTTTPIPTKTLFVTSTLPANCQAAYPDFCIQIGTRPSCDELPKEFTALQPDPLQYDGDGDGIGCER